MTRQELLSVLDEFRAFDGRIWAVVVLVVILVGVVGYGFYDTFKD